MKTSRPAIICDVDGVLASTVSLHAASWRRAFRTCSIEYSVTDDALTRGVPRPEGARRVLLKYDKLNNLSEAAQAALIAETCRAKQECFCQLIGTAKPLPGVPAALRRLRQAGYRLAVGSASRNADKTIEAIGLGWAFEIVVTPNDFADNAATDKSSVFLRAIERLGGRRTRSVVVEDAANGVECARRVGIACLAVATTEPASDLRAAGANLVLSEPALITPEIIEACLSSCWSRIGAISGSWKQSGDSADQSRETRR